MGGFWRRLRSPLGVALLVLALLTGGGVSLVVFEDQPDLTGLTAATSTEDLAHAESLLQITTDTSPASRTPLERVRPILECVDLSFDHWVAYFGFLNGNEVTVDVGHGRDNGLGPDGSAAGTPTTFPPGSSRFAFAVEMTPGQALVWNLQGRTATATETSPACQFGPYKDLTLPDPA